MPNLIDHCRICGNINLIKVLDLGEQALTGVFPHNKDRAITRGPLQLLKCHGQSGQDFCGLLQLAHSYDLDEMYGENYGYRSGLNPSMVRHLKEKVNIITEMVRPAPGDIIIDIGSNDSTTLQAYPPHIYELAGIDPTGYKFKNYYPPHIELISDFFSTEIYRRRFGDQQAKIITAFSMFYDVESPLDFMMDVRSILHPEGVWVFEQSYMPTMIERNAYDTVCHEHLEYYGLQQIKWMTDRADLRIVKVELNDTNGGSFSVAVAHASSNYPTCTKLKKLIEREKQLGFNTLEPYFDFAVRVEDSRRSLLEFLAQARSKGKRIALLGASTKGNVVLQFCDISERDVSCVGEVNPDKYGCYTPGTLIPIVPEEEMLASSPDYLLILPWHFRSFFENNNRLDCFSLVFPLPALEIRVGDGA